jgi:hypothetical protein
MSITTGSDIKADEFTPSLTAGETISAGDAVALDLSTGKVMKASASAWAYRINFIGFAIGASTLNNPIEVNVSHIISEKTGLTSGATYYLSDTNGAISTSAGTISRKIGIATSTTRIWRPKNGALVSGLISRAFSTTTCYAPQLIQGFSTNQGSVTINGTSLYSSVSADDISTTIQAEPDDVVSIGSFTNTIYTRIIDR